MPWVETFSAEQIARIIAGQRHSPNGTELQRQMLVDCIEALPGARAESPTDAMALLVVAQHVVSSVANPDTEKEAPTDLERTKMLQWAADLIARVVAIYEQETGIAAETYTGIVPARN